MDTVLILTKNKMIFSFTLTYILLLTTTAATFIEAIGTNVPFVRHLFNIETLISIVAGFFYTKFIQKISNSMKTGEKLDWDELTLTRYLDWSITTPLMLLVLMMTLSFHSKKKTSFKTYIIVILLNYFMLYVGYKGESMKNNNIMWLLSYAAFFVMYYIIYITTVGKGIFFNNFLFGLYLVVWTLYGVAYKLENEKKNIMFNYLDLVSKCFVGLGLWLYFTRLFK